MDWDKLKVFHAAAEAGSFTHAGEQLGLRGEVSPGSRWSRSFRSRCSTAMPAA